MKPLFVLISRGQVDANKSSILWRLENRIELSEEGK